MLPAISFPRLFSRRIGSMTPAAAAATPLPLDPAAAGELVRAAQQLGFIYVVDTPVRAALGGVFSGAAQLFSTATGAGARRQCETPNAKRGAYRYVGVGGQADVIAAFHMGNDDSSASALRGAFFGDGVNQLHSDANRWPPGDEWQSLRSSMREAFAACSLVSVTLLQALALGLGEEQLAFCKRHSKLDNELELKHYSALSPELVA